MTVYFFPRDKTFWLYHGSVLLLLSVKQVVDTLLWRSDVALNIIGGLLWLPLLTLAVLYYRHLYKKHQLHQLDMGKTLGLVVSYGLVAGFLGAAVMLGLILPFFWQDLLQHEAVISQKITLTKVILELLVSNSLQTTLFICAWIFTYISITGKRRIRETELANLHLQNSLREAQLSSLTNQLNPHFLFNALNNIRFMIHENPRNAEQMIIALSDMLRYSLEGSKRDKVPLHEELTIIEDYIAIMRVQLEDRLTFRMDMADNLDNCLVPPMMLQILVENAIKHGLDNRRQGGALSLVGTVTGDKLLLIISNDMADNNSKNTANTGIGLNNIRQRLKLLYGDSSNMTSTQDNDQFIIRITLPRESAL